MDPKGNKEDLKDLEMAKKRNHKIMITDEAIKKVPRIQYKNIPESEYSTIQELALSDFSLSDVQFLLRYASVKMMYRPKRLAEDAVLLTSSEFNASMMDMPMMQLRLAACLWVQSSLKKVSLSLCLPHAKENLEARK